MFGPLRLAAAVALSLAVGTTAVSVRANPNEDGSLDTGTREVGKDKLFKVYGSHYAHLNFDRTSMERNRRGDMQELREQGYGFPDAPNTNAYLNEVLGECLANQGPGKGVPYLARVVSLSEDGKPQKDARATNNGLIVVSVAFLQAMRSESELAFILAHEFGHVVMQHPESLDEYDQYLKGDATDGQKLSVGIIKAFSSMDMARNMMVRRHEDHSDFFALDAMRACKYNTGEAATVLSKIGAWDSKLGSMYRTGVELETQSGDAGKKGGGGLGSIFGGLVTAVDKGFDQLTEAGENPVRSTEDRQFLVKDYLDTYYPGLFIIPEDLRNARGGRWDAFLRHPETVKLFRSHGQ